MSRHMFARTGSAKNVTIRHEELISRYAYSTVTGGGESVTVVMGYDRQDGCCFCYVLFDAAGVADPLYASDDYKAGRACQDACEFNQMLAICRKTRQRKSIVMCADQSDAFGSLNHKVAQLDNLNHILAGTD